jgi:hypothetical protein
MPTMIRLQAGCDQPLPKGHGGLRLSARFAQRSHNGPISVRESCCWPPGSVSTTAHEFRSPWRRNLCDYLSPETITTIEESV